MLRPAAAQAPAWRAVVLVCCCWCAAASRAEDLRAAPASGALPAAQLPAAQLPAQQLPSTDHERFNTPAAQLALERGLDYLASLQAGTGDGSLASPGATRYAPVGLTALGTLALLAGGSTPERGPHGEAISRAVRYLLTQANASELSPQLGYIGSAGDQVSKMHGHGYATLVLAEAWCISPKSPLGREIESKLRAAVELIERTQNSEGAWYYEPRRGFEHEGSVTITLVQALRAARDSGLRIDPRVIQRAEDYVLRSQVEDGSYAYHLGSTQTSVGLSAAAIATLNMAGTYSGAPIDRGLDAIWRELLGRQDDPGRRKPIEVDHEAYERLYVAQAFWQSHDLTHFERWYPHERDQLLASQRVDGSWEEPTYGPGYATAINCLVLAMPEGWLPIFQR